MFEPVRESFSDAGSVIVFRIGQLGDTLVSIPSIRAIERRHPSQKKILLTDARSGNRQVTAWDVLEPLKIFHDVVVYDSALPAHKMAQQLVGLVIRLRRLAPQYVYNLSPYRTVFQYYRDHAFFKLLVGTKNYVAAPPAGQAKPSADGARLSRRQPEWQRLAQVVAPTASVPIGPLPISQDDSRRAADLLKPLRTAGFVRFIGVGPGSNMPAKIWPKERFLELGSILLRAYPDATLVVLGGASDAVVGEWLCEAWGPNALNLAGRLSIYESAAVLQRCHAYVGNDTGTMHLAALAGTPCVALFSARDFPGVWEPIGAGHAILRSSIECEGCMLEECKIRNNECLRRITVESVFQQVCIRMDSPR